MSAITQNTKRKHRNGNGGYIKSYLVKEAEVIPAGAFVGLDAAGYLVNWTAITADTNVFLGVALQGVTGDVSEDVRCSVNCTGVEIRLVAVTGASTIADLTPGKVYLANNNDFTISAPAGGGVVGRIVRFYDSTHFDVKLYTPEEYAAQKDI